MVRVYVINEILFVTGNPNKATEAARAIGSEHKLSILDIDLPEIQSLDPDEVINQKIKSLGESVQLAPGQCAITEDISMVIDAMGQLPGTYIKHFIEEVNASGVVKMARALQPTGPLRARVEARVGLLMPDGSAQVFLGRHVGNVAPPSGEYGFGFDFIFVPDDQPNPGGKTVSELGESYKDKYSHRAQALTKLSDYLGGL